MMKDTITLMYEVMVEMGIDVDKFNDLFYKKVMYNKIPVTTGEDSEMKIVETNLKDVEKFR